MDMTRIAGRPVVRKAATGIAVAVAAVALLGFLVLPPIVRRQVEVQAEKALHRKTTVGAVRINPFTLSVSIRGLKIADRETGGPFVAFDELSVDAQALSAWHRGPVLREITLRAPRVVVVRKEDGRYNFSDLVDEFANRPSPPDAKPTRFSLNNIRIVDGSIDFDDRPRKTRHAIRKLDLSVPFVSNLPVYVESYVQPAFSAVANGTPVSLGGKTRPFSEGRETTFEVDLRDVDIPFYLAYSPVPLKFRVPSGSIDAKARITYTQRRGSPPKVGLAGAAALKKFRIEDRSGAHLLSIPRLDVPIVSVATGPLRVRLGDVHLASPELDLARDREGKLTLLSLLPGGGAKPAGGAKAAEAGPKAGKEKAPAEEPARIEAEALRLTDGKIRFTDAAAAGGKPFRTGIDGIEVAVRGFTNERGKPFRLEASLSTESKERFRNEGLLTLAPLEAKGRFGVEKVVLKKYAPYYAKSVLFDVRDGLLDLSTGYLYRPAGDDAATSVDNLAVALSALKLRRRGDDADFLQLPRLDVKDAAIDLERKTARIGTVSGTRGALRAFRDEDGKVDLASLVPPAPGGAEAKTKGAPGRKAEAGRPWQFLLAKLSLDRFRVTWDDRQPEEAVLLTVSPLDIAAANLSNARNARGTASVRLTLHGGGTASLGGTVAIDPASADLSVKAKGIDLVPLQPYFTEKLAIELTGGLVDADGKLKLKAPNGAPLQAAWEGEAGIRGLATLDKENGEDFLKWEALHLSGMRIGLEPASVAIRELSLSGLYSRLIVHPDGSLNVQGIVRKEPPAAGDDAPAPAPAPAVQSPPAPAAPAAKPAPVSVGTVTLQDGTILFTDRHVSPNYTAKLEEVGGRVTGLSSEETKMADLSLRGRLDNRAPLEITGRINPLRSDLFVDLKVDFKDIDLSPMTPYSGRYAGYSIEKGKLSMGLKYLVANRKLDAGNRLFIDQFDFGEKVDSPDATKLPVRLAVALLKDRNGEIRLDLPVSGSLDDPKFSVWGVLWTVVKNLLVKAATSPFALLGALMGGGEELSYLEFPPGQASLDAAAEGKLRALAKALEQRPALKLDVVGHADPPADRDALRAATFDRKVRTQKLKELAKQGGAGLSLDNVSVAAAEYPKYLLKAYSAETFPKPRNFIGMQKDLPVPEMEKLMLTHIRVTDDDLRQLAQERAKRAIDFLVATKQVEAGRIFTVEPKSLAPEKKERQRDSRVEFVLK
jgi:uncharacterized protein involved in outer membrane biogenesis